MSYLGEAVVRTRAARRSRRAGAWSETSSGDLLSILRGLRAHGRPVVVALDGRGGAGKSTIARWLENSDSSVAVVHTDDLAWNHSFFEWDSILVERILRPARSGQLPISYRPPAWETHAKPGAVDVGETADLLIVEGSGSGRQSLSPWLDALVWVECDLDEAHRRVRTREGHGGAPSAFTDDWARDEGAFFADDTPWARARVVIDGDSGLSARGTVRIRIPEHRSTPESPTR